MKKYFENVSNLMVLMSIMCMVAVSSCGSDDDPQDNVPNASLIISGKNYGVLPYGNFMNWNDGTASFIFGNQNITGGNIDVNSGYTYVAVRIPYSSGDIPVGTFSGSDVDLDFDVNRIASSQKCDMTGWSMNLSMTVSRSGDKYVVDVTSNNLHIYSNDDDSGDGTKGSLSLHYEGSIRSISNM